jgi:ornithine--oxo-acid transaminase
MPGRFYGYDENTTENHLRWNAKYGVNNYKPLPVVIAKGKGVWVWDIEGNKYLDFLSAYSCQNTGYSHPKIVKAVVDQAKRCGNVSRAFLHDKQGQFMKTLAVLCGKDCVLPMNTGAEAVETAIKAARKWGLKTKGITEPEIIVFANNFHGRTTTIVGFSTEEHYREGFGPFAPGFKVVPYGDFGKLDMAVTSNTVAILFEPIQGEAGIIIPPGGFLKDIRDICHHAKILMIADEIQTGLGRTGKLFACDHERVVPDLYIIGKALGGGLIPVSAVVGNRNILDVFDPGSHGSTFGGYSLGCAAGLAALGVIVDEGLCERSAELGEYFMAKLREIKSPHIKEIRGRGLMIGLELNTKARPFCEALMKEGLLCKETHDMVIRFAPPLVITKKQIDWAIKRIKKVLEK